MADDRIAQFSQMDSEAVRAGLASGEDAVRKCVEEIGRLFPGLRVVKCVPADDDNTATVTVRL